MSVTVRNVWPWAAGSALGVVATCAFAQQESQGSRLEVLDEIVVTAQKRSENAQKVPISVSAVSGSELETLSATRLSDYAGYVPGLVVQNGGAPGAARIIMRGLPPLGSTSAVATYIDDAPFGSSNNWAAGSTRVLDMMPYDLERVEVLRGPQGTLYGANTLGGLLKYVTRSPDLRNFEARAGADMSNIDGASDMSWAARGGVNAPLIEDRLAVRASYYTETVPGYIDSPNLGLEDVNEAKQQGARVAFLWEPVEDLSVKLGSLWQKAEADGTDFVTLDPSAPGAPLTPFFGDRDQMRFARDVYEDELQHHSLTVAWDVGWASLTSITTYANNEKTELVDHGATLGPLTGLLCASSPGCPAAHPTLGLLDPGIITLRRDIELDKRTQELRLASNSEGRFEWMAGAFYTDEDSEQDQILDVFRRDRTPIPQIDIGYALLPTTFEEKAAFFNGTYQLTDRFYLSAGVRYSESEQSFVQVSRGILLLPADPPGTIKADPSTSSEEVTDYMVSPRFQVNDDVMVYARLSTGFRPGGPNTVFPSLPTQFDSDATTNYELGVKTQFLNDRGLFNVAVFHIDWEDIQTSVIHAPSGITYTDNLGEARSRGVELEFALRLLEGVTLGLNGAFTDAIATEGAGPLGGATGDRLPFVSRWNGAATVGYEVPVGASWTWSTNLGVRYVGDLHTALESSPTAYRADAYSIVDLSTAFANDRWSVRLFANNLANEETLLGPGPVTNLLTRRREFVNSVINQPRRIGVSFEMRF